MAYTRGITAACLCGVLLSCVTINVYFPAAAAEKAADRIIDEVWGRQPGRVPPQEAPAAQPQPQSRRSAPQPALSGVIELLIPAAQAAEPDLNISTPAIDKITASMKARHAKLVKYYDDGAIGLTSDGLVELRDPKAVPLSERRKVNDLIAAENRDRNALYREIARANGHPDWEDDIRSTFARQWVQNAPGGWWYKQGGQWKRK